MPHVRTSPRAIISRDGRFLVARYHDALGDWYVFPGGGQQHGEDLPTALRREIREELGAEIAVGDLRFVRECLAARHPGPNLPPDFHNLELFFACDLLTEPQELGPTPDLNQRGHEWRTVEELRTLRFYPAAMPDALAGLLAAYLGAIP